MKAAHPLRMLLALVAALALGSPALAAAPAKAAGSMKPTGPRLATADFAMGCFWCAETAFEGLPGVTSVVSGYTGGKELKPTYEQVSAHMTGHYESVQVTFDPTRMSYARLLDIFWHSVDPTQGDGQFCDRGHQYQSVIFVRDAAQRAAAETSKKSIESSGVLKKAIVTQILPASTFWPAEGYHQDFWKKNPARYHDYREGCGRDQRLVQIWGDKAAKPSVH